MKTEKKSAVRYLGLVTKDLYRIMPWEITALIAIGLMKSAAAFLQVSVTAAFFDTAGKWLQGAAGREEVLRQAALFAVMMGLPLGLGLVQERIENIPLFMKHHLLIHKLLGRVVSTPLIRFEEPEFHNEIWRAKMCVYNFGLTNYFFGFFDLIPLLFQFVGTVWVIAAFHVYFIPLALVSVLPSLIARYRYWKGQYAMKRKQTPLERRKDYLWDVLTGKDLVKELRTSETESYIRKKWEQALDSVMDETFRFETKNAGIFLMWDLFKLSGIAVSIAMSLYFADKGLISVGQFAACLTAFGSLQYMTENVLNLFSSQKWRADFAGDYYDFFDGETESEEGAKYPGLQDAIQVRDVAFRYPKAEKEALSGVSFQIKKGERVVIVGENGSGKTTLSKLIAGIYQPEKGQVLYDGQEAGSYERGSFYRNFSVIQQNFVKYQLSMRENIGISKPSHIHQDERLMASAKAAGIEKIVRRVGGLDAQLGREFDGVELSGGEWQKVAIARGLNKEERLSKEEKLSVEEKLSKEEGLSVEEKLSKEERLFVEEELSKKEGFSVEEKRSKKEGLSEEEKHSKKEGLSVEEKLFKEEELSKEKERFMEEKLFMNRDIILLDEPTSALDPLVEYDILTKFLNLTKGKTSVIISHRIGLGKFADRIIVMKKGHVAESGTHSELLAAGGEYSRMWHEQAKWYE